MQALDPQNRAGAGQLPAAPSRDMQSGLAQYGDTDQAFAPMGQLGLSGLKRAAGYVQEEYLSELVGQRGVRVYTEMSEQDPVISGILFVIEMLVRGVKWKFVPADDSEKAKAFADRLEECKDDMHSTFNTVISEALSLCPYGWAAQEMTFKLRQGQDPPMMIDPITGIETEQPTSKYDDGLIGWHKIEIRSQDSLFYWEFDQYGEVTAMWQIAPPIFIPVRIPMSKLILWRTTARKGNPEGRSMLRGAYEPWYFKRHIQRIEGIGVERDLAGLPVAFVPPALLDTAATAAQKAILAAIKKIVTNIRRDEQEGIVFPLQFDDGGHQLYDLKLLSTGGTRQFDTDKIIQRHEQRMAMTVLADFIFLGHETVGSFALSSDKTSLFAHALGAILEMMAATFTEKAVKTLFRLNGWDLALMPTLVPGDMETVNVKDIASALKDLSLSGMPLFPNPELEQYIFDIMNIPVQVSAVAEVVALAKAGALAPGNDPADEAQDQGDDQGNGKKGDSAAQNAQSQGGQ